MGLGILLALLSLRSGMRMRRARQQKRTGRAELRRSHLRVVKITVPWIMVGFAAGPLVRWWVQGETPFQTAHAWIGLTAVLLWSTTATVGHMLEIGDKRFTSDRGRDAHTLLSLSAVLASAVAGVFGYALLP